MISYINKTLKLLLTTLLILIASRNISADVDEIRLFVPVFEGPGSLGKNVATIMNLQIWRTLRREPDRNPQGEDFGRGMIVWSTTPLAIASHDHAEELATHDNIFSQFVLWGETFNYGKGVISQTYLSIPRFSDHQRDGMTLDDFRDNHNELWQVTTLTDKGAIKLTLDIPTRRYEFSPIVLSNSIVKKYSLPSRLIMYKEADVSSEIISEVGDKYIGIEPRGHYQYIYSNGKRGWVYLPDLAKERNEVVDFIGGIIRIYRADWLGAKELMDNVINNSSTPTALKIDALLYKGRCLEETGVSGDEVFKLAYQLNSFDQNTVRYWIMSKLLKLTRLKKENSQGHIFKDELKQTKEFLNDNLHLFRQSSSWLKDVDSILIYLSS